MRMADPASVAVRIGRKGILIALLLAFQAPARGDDSAVYFTTWVNTLYIGTTVLREAGTDLSDSEMRGLFTPELQAMFALVEDRTPPPNEPGQPILHVLLGWTNTPNRRIDVFAVSPYGDDKAQVTLAFDRDDRQLFQLILTGVYNASAKAWQIDDIDYGEGGPDRTLRQRLKRMQDWPKRAN